MNFSKHLVQCSCILPQFKGEKDVKSIDDIIFHKFIVFSTIDDATGFIDEKYAQCNSCGAIHRVFEVGKSEILPGRDEYKSVITKDDIKNMIPDDIQEVLLKYNLGTPYWEELAYVYEHEVWQHEVVLNREVNEKSNVSGKILKVISGSKWKIYPYELALNINTGV